MVDFHRLRESFLEDVYHEEVRIIKTPDRRLRTGTVRKDTDHEPKVLIAKTRCWEKCFCVTQKLQERKNKALQFLEDIISQKKELYDKELAFQQRFLEFNEQVTLNDHKRQRAFAKLMENIAYARKRSEQMEILSKKISQLKQYKEKFKEEILKHLIYEEFLESILYEFDSKATLNHVIIRYCNLESKRRYLIARFKKRNDKLKAMFHDSMDSIIVHCENIMNMRKQISQNMVRYEEAVNRTNELECLQKNMWDICSNKLEDVILSIQGIRNLNDIMNKRRLAERQYFLHNKGTESMPDIINKVETIKDTMGQLYLVMKRVESRFKMIKKACSKEDNIILNQKSSINSTSILSQGLSV